MAEKRKLAAILAADVVGFSRLTGVDEDLTLARLRALRSDVFDPTIAVHNGRVVKRTGDGTIVEFGSVVDAVRCGVEIQYAMLERNAGVAPDRRIVLRIGIHVGDVIEESDGDLMGDGVNIAARLEGVAAPGGICLSEDAYRQVKARLDFAVSDLGNTKLKNIIEPIRVYAVQIVTPWNTAPRAGSAELAVASKVPTKPSIAVLPFVNMSSDLEQLYLSDGITEDIITELSRYPELLVIARNSSFRFRDSALDMKLIGQELGVEYLVEGSLRKAGNRLRITAQLIEAGSGAHLWAEKYDRDLVDIFSIQDEVTQTVAATLVGRVIQSGTERAQRKPTGQWAAHDCVLQARKHVHQYDLDAALPLLHQALAVDPLYAQAHAHLANCYVEKFYHDAEQSVLANALSHADTALSIDPNDGMSHMAMGYVQTALRSYDLGGLHFARAMTLNPNSVRFQSAYAFWLFIVGRNSEALDHMEAATKRDPFKGIHYYQIRGYALFDDQRYEEAIESLDQVHPKQSYDRAFLAAAYAYLGRDAEAQCQTAILLREEPRATVSWFSKFEHRKNPAIEARLLTGFRMAGIPE